jgi:hypothetical protein
MDSFFFFFQYDPKYAPGFASLAPDGPAISPLH